MPETLAVRQVDIGNAMADMWRSVLLFIPRAIAFIAILVVGWLIARAVLKIVDTALERVGLRQGGRTGRHQACAGTHQVRRQRHPGETGVLRRTAVHPAVRLRGVGTQRDQ